MEFATGFTVISDEQELSIAAEADASGPARLAAFDQNLYSEADEPWQRGELIGEVSGTWVTTPRGRAIVNVTFTIGEDTIVAHGVLPIEGSDLGRGRLAVTGGTGEFHKAAGTVDMETRNPKRWSFGL